MILGQEDRMLISKSGWSNRIKTYQFLAYQTDELSSQEYTKNTKTL